MPDPLDPSNFSPSAINADVSSAISKIGALPAPATIASTSPAANMSVAPKGILAPAPAPAPAASMSSALSTAPVTPVYPTPNGQPIPVTTSSTASTPTTPSYTYNPNASIIDYLTSVGQDNSFNARSALAAKSGIANYTGTAAQNVALLAAVRGGASTGTTPPPPAGTATPPPPTPAPGSSITSSSTGVRNTNADITSTVAGLTPPDDGTSAAQTASDAYQANLQSQIDALEQRRADEVKQINDQFDQQKATTTFKQDQETGSTSVGLARIGGYLGGTASGTGTMLTLAKTHQDELTTLEGQRQAAIQAANSAITDKQFALAQQKAQEVKDIEATIDTRKNTFFNQSIAAQTAASQNEATQRANVSDQLTKLSSIDPSLVDQATKDQIDTFYKTPGFTDAYLKAANAASSAKTASDVAAAHSAYVDLLQKLPAGQSIKMPDGSTVTGIGKTADIETFNKEDSNGNVTIVKFDKGTNSISEYSAGQIGKSADNGTSTRIAPASDAINALRDPSTGYVSLKDYVNMYNQYVSVNKGHGDEFSKTFDPKFYLSPTDRTQITSSGSLLDTSTIDSQTAAPAGQ